MRNPTIFLTLVAIALAASPARAGESRYVGARVCAGCHGKTEPGNPFHAWQTSKHADAYRTLKARSESKPRQLGDVELWIVEVGRGTKYGLPTPAMQAKECLPCHTTAFGAEAKLLASSFDVQDGVQCESCHGPGSAHADAMAENARDGGHRPAGLKRPADERAIEAQCTGCHERSGPCGDFDFASMWPKIRHSASRGR